MTTVFQRSIQTAIDTFTTNLATVDTVVDGIATDIGDPSGHTLTSLTAKLGDGATTVTADLGTLKTNVGDPSGDTLTSLTAKLGDPATAISTTLEYVEKHLHRNHYKTHAASDAPVTVTAGNAAWGSWARIPTGANGDAYPAASTVMDFHGVQYSTISASSEFDVEFGLGPYTGAETQPTETCGWDHIKTGATPADSLKVEELFASHKCTQVSNGQMWVRAWAQAAGKTFNVKLYWHTY